MVVPVGEPGLDCALKGLDGAADTRAEFLGGQLGEPWDCKRNGSGTKAVVTLSWWSRRAGPAGGGGGRLSGRASADWFVLNAEGA